MASNDTNYPVRPQPARSYTPMQAASSASTWYLVVGAAILLMVLYLLTTGMMRPAPDPVAAGCRRHYRSRDAALTPAITARRPVGGATFRLPDGQALSAT